VTCFLDAESTLRILPPSSDRIIFLIDYNMPGDNGIILKKKLVPPFPNAKYVLISGLFDAKLTEAGKAAGFDALVPKPFRHARITQKIEELLGVKPKESLVDMVKRQTGTWTYRSPIAAPSVMRLVVDRRSPFAPPAAPLPADWVMTPEQVAKSWPSTRKSAPNMPRR
jgi:DNA-binding NarL/FixJ family response regulator